MAEVLSHFLGAVSAHEKPTPEFILGIDPELAAPGNECCATDLGDHRQVVPDLCRSNDPTREDARVSQTTLDCAL